jgi:hypothetical protein
MMADMHVKSFEDLQRWRISAQDDGSPVIVIQTCPSLVGRIAEPLARCLNEYDQAAEGRWATFEDELLRAISSCAPERALLGVSDGCLKCPAGSACLQRKVYRALAGFGYVVLEGVLAAKACEGLEGVFRVGIGSIEKDLPHPDLVIHPAGFAMDRLLALIGDTCVEWLATRRLVSPH